MIYKVFAVAVWISNAEIFQLGAEIAVPRSLGMQRYWKEK